MTTEKRAPAAHPNPDGSNLAPGRTASMRRAQDQLHHQEAARQAAILDALPAHVALLDAQGTIV